MPMIV